ncbi:hypothetical protein HELRODRAFT_163177 [Helobdella robusta]|uniref:Uncharacterized protein n=1 Tax=Helobdella robusta TaxID=6412 RepID=T1ETR5_HELRO|nr:hypothetical protein HELRODRAFT_163177 [Helobdella robusta]ESN96145.1 hypothetical protein HELRODRAFT_163177 [Helobdella robusta]
MTTKAMMILMALMTILVFIFITSDPPHVAEKFEVNKPIKEKEMLFFARAKQEGIDSFNLVIILSVFLTFETIILATIICYQRKKIKSLTETIRLQKAETETTNLSSDSE